MFYGVTHVDVPVTDVDHAAKLWRDLLALKETRRGDGFMDLDSGSVIVRLLQVGQVEHPASLRVQVSDVQAAFDALTQAGARPLYEPMRTPALELIATVADADGNGVTVWRELTEDEYEVSPDLPKQGQWHAEAEALLKSLLSHVPAIFRALARRKVTRIVEEVADWDKSSVTREHVIRGYILASAKITRYRLVEPLRKHGIDPDRYREEFEA